jgi:hypothetical protein
MKIARVTTDNNGDEIIMANLENNQENIEPHEKKQAPDVSACPGICNGSPLDSAVPINFCFPL